MKFYLKNPNIFTYLRNVGTNNKVSITVKISLTFTDQVKRI